MKGREGAAEARYDRDLTVWLKASASPAPR